jgi:hypothetical protein
MSPSSTPAPLSTWIDVPLHDHNQSKIPECMEGLLAVVEKFYYDDEEMQAQAIAEASCYMNKDGLLSRPAVFKAAKKMPQYRWSQMYVSQYPAYQRIQIGLLTLVYVELPLSSQMALRS